MQSLEETGTNYPVAETLPELLQRAQQGDVSALPELRHQLNVQPAIWRQHGDVAAHAQAAWLNLIAGQDLLLHETVMRKMDDMRAELLGTSPSPLECLLVERIVACWLQTHYADALYAQGRSENAPAAVRKELLHRQDSSQRRYLAAIKQLALVRRLLVPAQLPSNLSHGQEARAEKLRIAVE